MTPDERTIPIVIYRPEQLFVGGDPARGFQPQTTGTSCTVSWDDLTRLLGRAHVGDPTTHPDPNTQKSARGGWSACRLRGGRRLASAFVETRLLGLDIDRHGDIDRALRAFQPFRKLVHATYKSTEAEPRCRVILPLKESCFSTEKFKRAHHAVRYAVVRAGWFEADDFDDAGSDPSRLWYLPMVAPGVSYRFEVTDGELLDIEKLLPSRPSLKKTTSPTPSPTTANRSAALAFAERKMADTQEGRRHTTVFSLAAWLGTITPPIPDDQIEASLLAHAPEGHDAEFRRTIRDGIRRARAA
ncbi:MAG: hypothetical protein JNL21_38650 [Myxococcales bacterium]|nr:hypothetical protein [Myxococcales bacterium]